MGIAEDMNSNGHTRIHAQNENQKKRRTSVDELGTETEDRREKKSVE